MNERWRKLIRYGIVSRTVFGDRPPIEVEYALTPLGRRFMAILDEVRQLQDDLDSRMVAVGDDAGYDAAATRLFRRGATWDRTPAFGRDDLLTVAKVADLANTRIYELQNAIEFRHPQDDADAA